IPFVTKEAGKVSINLYSPDGDLVKTLKSGPLPAGAHTLAWDGKDASGLLVPDESWSVVATLNTEQGETRTDDPRQYSGGEVFENIPVSFGESHAIHYELPRPARVLVRAGVKGGPMMRSMLNWKPRTAGSNVTRWSGFDADRLIDLRSSERLAVMVTAFALPEYSIITTGNQESDYRAWKEQQPTQSKLPVNVADQQLLERDGRRISRHFYATREEEIDPRISVRLVGDLPANAEGLPIIAGAVNIRVDMHEEDIESLQQSLFEVAFFTDFDFVSEEEQGYVPLTWRYDPGGLEPGRHILTVNVSGFKGQVGVKSIPFYVPETGQ
ncbi:FlgD immunoglobulin-like domain containing protein, partial [Endozoicomonas acroporae]|uniref:FlgD immunoglobulin-like domain containing protein n=1 Tax=Endozoicomonas acroporae TaxID=1701104 RepID=UPI003D7A025D